MSSFVGFAYKSKWDRRNSPRLRYAQPLLSEPSLITMCPY